MASTASPQKIPWVKLSVGLVVLAGIAVVVARGVDVRGLLERVMAVIRQAGPAVFFGAMALLPAVGAADKPLSDDAIYDQAAKASPARHLVPQPARKRA